MKYLSPLLFILFLMQTGCDNQLNKTGFVLEEATISSIRAAIFDGSVTCEQLVGMYIERIEKYDQASGLNAIVLINPNALEIARQKDKLLTSNDVLPPLHGIPVIVKDNYNTIGLQTAAGSMAMKGFEPETDAYIVKKLKEAGAIVIAKSNMAEWAFSPMVTISSIAGETRNPYNLDFVPAGSSGGTAASVAANFGTVGLGTDTGNSIRGPSSHNSLVGFRTTLGLISRAGIVPLYLRNDVGGPMTRSVEDATIILDIIAGYDPDDPLTERSEGKRPVNYIDFLDQDGLIGSRIGIFQNVIDLGVDQQIDSLFNNAVSDLENSGAIIVDSVNIEYFEELRSSQWAPTFQYDLNNYLASQGASVPVKSLAEIVAAGNYSDYIEDNLNYHLRYADNPEERDPPVLGPFSDPKRIAFRNAIEQKMDELKLDALIYPSWSYPPARIGKFDEYRGDNNQLIAPHTGQPAFTIPMGYTSNNLPAGLQFLGRAFDEPTLIKLTYSYEQATHHRKPPENFSGNQ